jgi:RimJ/RimL family protein N-acetyltransferase
MIMKLVTPRLVLREWREDDLGDLIEGLNDLDVSQWLARVPYPYTKKDGAAYITYCLEASQQKPRTYYDWAITIKGKDRAIGSVVLADISFQQGIAGGGIWLNKKYWGHGYGQEAWNKRIEFAFASLSLRRLNNGYFVGNLSSQKMQEKSGYQVEGLKRESLICLANGQIKDVVITGLLKKDWQNCIRDAT